MRLNLIASDLLVLSDLESGRPLPNPEPVSVRESMETAVRSVESEARLRGVEVQYEPPAEDFQLAAMKVRLEQVLINLLDNAVKFNRPGGSVRISAHLNGNDQGYITVSDTGIGIPSEDLPRIFERFYRVDKARSRAVGGTGLGLSIVKHAIDQMRGTVSVESTLGRGSQFTITLPVLHQEAASTAD